jgi:hypothetical protein
MTLTSHAIRKTFIEFFRAKGGTGDLHRLLREAAGPHLRAQFAVRAAG